MAISDRITSIEEHIKESYQELEGIGIDTTGVNKNLENIPKLIDGYWETLPKVTGEGTSITLDNTKEGKMKIDLKGNTSQATAILPSEYTQVDYITSSGTQYIDTGIIPNNTQNYYFTYALNNITQNQVLLGSRSSGNLSSSTNQVFYSLNIDTETSKFASKFILGTNLKETIIAEIQTDRVYSTSLKISDYTSNYNNQSTKNFYLMGFNNVNNFAAGFRGKLYVCKIYDNNILVRNFVPCYRNSDNEVGLYDLVNNVFYTNSGTGTFTYGSVVTLPNPDYPQDIHVVSGDNSIEVCGKNLANINNISNSSVITIENDTIKLSNNSSTSGYISSGIKLQDLCPTLKEGDVVYLFFDNTSSSTLKDRINVNGDWFTNASKTITQAMLNAYIIMFGGYNETAVISNFMITKVNDSSYQPYKNASYPINLGDIELCKIGDYQDSIKKSTGKNLLDINTNVLNDCYIATANMKLTTASGATCYWFEAKDNTTYTMSRDKGDRLIIGGYNSTPQLNDTGTLIYDGGTSTATTYTFTNTNYKYIVLYLSRNATATPNWVMLNEGTTALDYEPYGKVWYLKKEIGKVVLNGTINGAISSIDNYGLKDNVFAMNIIISNIISGNSSLSAYSENYHVLGTGSWNQWYSTASNVTLGDMSKNSNGTGVFIGVPKEYNSTNLGKQYLASNPSNLYYQLATPTYETITDTTLISQLEALKKSYEGQTNISQTNNDLASILNATALEEM